VTPLECPHEHEIVQAVLSGRIEQFEEARRHADTCEVCREVAAVARSLGDDRDGALHDVQVPAAGQVWWRAAIRARLDAAHSAERPMTWAHGVAGACAAGLTLGIVGLAWPTIDRVWTWLADGLGSLMPDAAAVTDLAAAALQQTLPIGLLAAACLLLAPLALCLAFLSDDGGK
jgi:hypothetical protein